MNRVDPEARPAPAEASRAAGGQRAAAPAAGHRGLAGPVGEAPIAEVARRFAIPEDEVVRELELAACCGLPPYSPDDLLEIMVTERDGRGQPRPGSWPGPAGSRPAEGFALAAAARTILAVPGADEDGSLARALAKLDAALGDRAAAGGRPRRPVAAGRRPPRPPTTGRQLEIEYHSASSDETTRRVVDPLAVVSLDGHWYLDAYCHRAGGLRRFRVDRIRSVRDPRAPPPRADAPTPPWHATPSSPGPAPCPVRLALGPGAAWVADTVPVLEVATGTAVTEVTLAVGGTAWLERLLLQLGPGARVLDPPELRGAGAAAARRVLRRYATGASMKSMKDNEKLCRSRGTGRPGTVGLRGA